jgi:hypothetical protein
MAHFAELNSNNVVLRVVVGCNQDVANNGGDQSEQAAGHFKTVCPLSNEGVKWVQTSYNHSFRKQYAGIGYTFDSTKDKFISIKPFASWSLDSNDDWQAPVAYPTVTIFGDNQNYFIYWNEENLKWMGVDDQYNIFVWIPSSLSWLATGDKAPGWVAPQEQATPQEQTIS